MKKLLSIFTILLMSAIWSFGQDPSPLPSITCKQIVSPNGLVWYYDSADSLMKAYKGKVESGGSGWLVIASKKLVEKEVNKLTGIINDTLDYYKLNSDTVNADGYVPVNRYNKGLAAKVSKTGDETIYGMKTFAGGITYPEGIRGDVITSGIDGVMYWTSLARTLSGNETIPTGSILQWVPNRLTTSIVSQHQANDISYIYFGNPSSAWNPYNATVSVGGGLSCGKIDSGDIHAVGNITGTNLSGTNTGDNAVNSLYSGLVSNATHTGDATGSTELTLKTVNSNIGTFNNVTINAKGLATAGSNVSYLVSSDISGKKDISDSTATSGYTRRDRLASELAKKEPLLPSTPTNPDQKFLNGNRLWALIPSVGGGGYPNNIYFTTIDSDISGYKTLNYTPEPTATELTATITNQELLVRSYIYPDTISTEIIDAGTWSFNLRVKVSGTQGVSQARLDILLRHANNTETLLWSTYTDEINNTDYQTIRKEISNQSFFTSTTDRLVAKAYFKTTAANAITFYTIIGDGDCSYFTTPLKPRHDTGLRAWNADPNYQHMTPQSQTFGGVKTFTSSPIVPTPTTNYQVSTKKYVDDGLSSKEPTLTKGNLTASSTKVAVTGGTGAVIGSGATVDVIESNLTLSNIGGSVTDSQVPNTITLDNITQVTNRSHANLSDVGTNTHSQIDTHIASTSNPHSVTSAQVGLGNVTNDSQVKRSEMGAAGGVATLLLNGKLPSSQVPSIAISETFPITNEGDKVLLSSAEKGDIAIVSTTSKSYILKDDPYSVESNWVYLRTPESPVTSVNGQVGNVSLTTTNISEGTNKYYTDTRVSNNTDVSANTSARHNAVTLTTNNSSGAAQLTGQALNIPNYTLSGLGGEPAFTKNTAFNKNFGTTSGTVLEGRTFDNFIYGNNQRATTPITVDNDLTKSGFYFSGDVSGGIGAKSLIHANWNDGDNVWMQISNPYADANNIYWRNNDFGTISAWKKFWTEGNFNPSNYSPVSGNNNYLWNNNINAQNGNCWIDGYVKAGEFNLNGAVNIGKIFSKDSGETIAIYPSTSVEFISLLSGLPTINFNARSGAATFASTLSATQLQSTTTTAAPLTVASSTMVSNLNADLLDGKHASEFITGTGTAGYLPVFTGVGSLGNSIVRDNGSIVSISKDATGFDANMNNSQFKIQSADGSQKLNFGYDVVNDYAIFQAVHSGVDVKPILLNPYGGSVFVGYASDPTSNNKLAVNGNGYFNGTITASFLAGTGTRLTTATSTGQLGAITNGSDGQILTLASGSPTWANNPSEPLLGTPAANGYVLSSTTAGVRSWVAQSAADLYKGSWDASTNTPTLANGTGTAGWYYICSTAGTVNFGAGNISFGVLDKAYYNGSAWEKISGSQVLQPATASLLGGVKIGSGVTVQSDGTISVSTNYQSPLSGTGFVKSSAGTISYDTNTYLTGITSSQVTTALGFTPYNSTNPARYISSYTETDPIFNAHTVKNISNGTGLLRNNGYGTWSYDNASYITNAALSGYATQSWVQSNFDNYGYFRLLANGVLAGDIGSTNTLNIKSGSGIQVSTDASNSVTISATGGGGTVTSITAGTGLSGGTITTSGTIAVDFGITHSTVAYGDHTHSNYLTGNQTITLSGIVTGSGTTAITTSIADAALSIAKTSGLQSSLDGKLSLSGGTLTGALNGTSITLSGNLTCAEGYRGNSDIRLKKDIKNIRLDASKIKLKQFEFKADSTNRIRYGVIAQEVENIAPELVYTDEKGIKSVAYIDLIIAKLNALEKENAKMKEDIETLKRK